MSQVSKVNLEGIVQKELYDEFSWIVSQLRDIKEVEGFFSELLTKTEKIMLAKRLAIAVLLTRGYTYRDIRQVLRVSFPTIRSMQFWLDHGRGGLRNAVEKISKRWEIQIFLGKVDKVLDKIIPDTKKLANNP